MTKLRSTAALTFLLLTALTGCGSGEVEATGNPKQELRRWFAGVEENVEKMEQKQRGFTQFQVAGQPPSKADLLALSSSGVEAGETAAGAVGQLDTTTALTHEEAAGLYCYFFAFYVDLESSPGESELEVVIFNLVKSRLLPSAPPAEVRRSADALRKAMVKAEKGGRRAPEVAAAVFC